MAMTELVLTFRKLGLRLLSSNNITGRITPTESTIVLKPFLVHILLTFNRVWYYHIYLFHVLAFLIRENKTTQNNN